MEFIALIAIGLNPYIGMFVLAALAAFTGHVPYGTAIVGLPDAALGMVLVILAAASGLAAPVDFVFGKFVRFAPLARRISQLAAPVAGALAAVGLSTSQLPLALIAASGALGAWAVASMLTAVAARASRSAAWIGLGHIPVLMAAATAAACIIPLGVARPAIGYVLCALAVSLLSSALLLTRRPSVAPVRTSARALSQAA